MPKPKAQRDTNRWERTREFHARVLLGIGRTVAVPTPVRTRVQQLQYCIRAGLL